MADYEVLFGIQFDNVDFDEFCAAIDALIEKRSIGFVATPNVDHVVNVHRNPAFKEAYAAAWMRVSESTLLMWMARWLGKPLKEKLSGSDLLPRLAAWAAENRRSVYFFGAAEGIAEEAARRLQAEHPALAVAGTYAPPLGFEMNDQENTQAIDRLKASGADICFVALGSPKQEIWMARHQERSGVPVMIGVGAAFDFVSGHTRRAPVWMQRAGLEWLYRLVQQPGHLWKRYLVTDTYMAVLFVREWIRTRRHSESEH